jgi:uncharacterized SAM-binding protein YcdF (DUF218 family)
VLFWNKLLPIFVLPLAWVMVLLAIALWRRRRWPVIAALAVLYVASTPVVGSGLFHWLESAYGPQSVTAVEPADAIVPLGGILGPLWEPGHVPNVGEGGERLEAGIALWQAKKAPWVVFTGGRAPWTDLPETEGALVARLAVGRGVPAEQVLVTREVGNTADEARAVRDLMRARGWKKIILVTSAWHMRRAARQFRKAGVDFVPFPVDYQVTPLQPLTLLDFLPRADGLRATEWTLRELYGIAFYAIFGRA